MKKALAITLLLVFLFNLFGYRLLIGALRQTSSHRLESMIDQQDYREEELVEIRVAMNMPYQQRFTEYERHYGQITLEGIEYTYVKRKIEGDILILKCIPHLAANRLQEVADNITASQGSQQAPQNNPAKSLAKIFSIECDAPSDSQTETSQTGKLAHHDRYSHSLKHRVICYKGQPPRSMA